MFEHILDCPRCSSRFTCEYDGEEFPKVLRCPECNEYSSADEFTALVLCRECHVNLKVPLPILYQEGNACPQCGTEILPDHLSTMIQGAETFAGTIAEKEEKRMLQDGEFFDKFRIVRLLGKGGMAEVYLAEHLLLKQLCALKLMQKSSDQEENPIFIKRFIREAKVTHSLNHPNIVRVFDAGSDFKTNYLFLAMEYVEGTTLHDLICDRSFSESDLLELLTVMADALKLLEEAKIVHRDIKPSNIMYTNDGVYKLMDMGIAKMESNHQAGDMTLTMEQSTIGTPGYASPEQCSSAHQVDIRSDIFSLGATLYHAATGTIPFTGETPVEVILKTTQSDPVPIKNFRSDLSNNLINLISRMMKKRPSERYQNISELQEAIEKVKQGKRSSSPVRSLKEKAAALSTVFLPQKDNALKSILKWSAILLLPLIAAGIAFYMFFPQEKEDSKQENLAGRLYDMPPLPVFPDSSLRPRTNGDIKEYPRVNLTFQRSQRGDHFDYTFNQLPFNWSPKAQKAIRNGLLDLSYWNDEVPVIKTPTLLNTPWQTVSLNFRMKDTNEASLFSWSGLQVFVYKKTLRVVCQERYYNDTQIVIPSDQWVNLAFLVNYNEGRLHILSGDRLLSSSIFPLSTPRRADNFSFHTSLLNRNAVCEVDFLALNSYPFKFQLRQPAAYERFTAHRTPLPNIVFTYVSPQTVPQKTAGTPTPQVLPKPEPVKKPEPKQETAVKAVPSAAPPAVKKAEKKPALPAPVQKTGQKAVAQRPAVPPSKPRKGVLLERWHKSFSPLPPPENMTADAQLHRALQEYAKYARAVKLLQDSLKGLPPGLAPEIVKKRRAIAETAAQLCKLRQQRLVYLRKRNQSIRTARNNHYRDSTAKRIHREVLEYTRDKKDFSIEEKDHDFARKLYRLLSDSYTDPNIKIQDASFDKYSGPILRFAVSGRVPRHNDFLRLLMSRYAEPVPIPEPHSDTIQALVNYGVHSSDLNRYFDKYFLSSRFPRDTVLDLVALFSDGAVPAPHHLSFAVRSGQYDVALFLLACGVDPNAFDKQGETALFHTWRHPKGKNLRDLLLAGGADPEIRSKAGKKAEDFDYQGKFAAAWPSDSSVKALISKQIPVDFCLYDGYTLLTKVCDHRSVQKVRLLLDLGANPNLADLRGNKPLAMLFDCRNKRNTRQSLKEEIPLMMMLLQKGALFNVIPLNGTPSDSIISYILETSVQKDAVVPQVAKYLKSLSKEQWNHLFHLVNLRQRRHGLSPQNRQLILQECPGDILARDLEKFVVLRLTPKMMQRVLDAGISPNATAKGRIKYKRFWRTGMYPLLWHLLKHNQSAEVIELLLRAGANPRWKDNDGRSLEQMARNPKVRKLLSAYKRRR